MYVEIFSYLTTISASAKDQSSSSRKGGENEGGGGGGNASSRGSGGAAGGGNAGNQQQDWSILWSCFDNPLTLLATTESLPKGMQVFIQRLLFNVPPLKFDLFPRTWCAMLLWK